MVYAISDSNIESPRYILTCDKTLHEGNSNKQTSNFFIIPKVANIEPDFFRSFAHRLKASGKGHEGRGVIIRIKSSLFLFGSWLFPKKIIFVKKNRSTHGKNYLRNSANGNWCTRCSDNLEMVPRNVWKRRSDF